MASVLHGSARTTPRIRAELQASKDSARALAALYAGFPRPKRAACSGGLPNGF
jgi:hypothetical protein